MSNTIEVPAHLARDYARVREENSKLRTALFKITMTQDGKKAMRDIARDALIHAAEVLDE